MKIPMPAFATILTLVGTTPIIAGGGSVKWNASESIVGVADWKTTTIKNTQYVSAYAEKYGYSCTFSAPQFASGSSTKNVDVYIANIACVKDHVAFASMVTCLIPTNGKNLPQASDANLTLPGPSGTEVRLTYTCE